LPVKRSGDLFRWFVAAFAIVWGMAFHKDPSILRGTFLLAGRLLYALAAISLVIAVAWLVLSAPPTAMPLGGWKRPPVRPSVRDLRLYVLQAVISAVLIWILGKVVW
jgi:hypothetical protein